MSDETAPLPAPLDLPLPPGWNLTKKQRAAVGAFCSGSSRKEALQVAGYKAQSVTSSFNQLINSPRVRPALAYALAKAGVVDQLKAETLAAALQANREYQTNIGVIAGGPDHGTRLKALTIALRLDGDLGGVQVEGSETFESHVQAAQIAGYSEE